MKRSRLCRPTFEILLLHQPHKKHRRTLVTSFGFGHSVLLCAGSVFFLAHVPVGVAGRNLVYFKSWIRSLLSERNNVCVACMLCLVFAQGFSFGWTAGICYFLSCYVYMEFTFCLYQAAMLSLTACYSAIISLSSILSHDSA